VLVYLIPQARLDKTTAKRSDCGGFFDLLIADEVHQFKNLSGQGYAFGALSGINEIRTCRSPKDVWTAFRKKELEMEGHAGGSGPVAVDPGPLAPEVEKRQVKVEQIGDRVLKVAFTRFVGRRKTTTQIEVKQGELDEVMKGKTGPAQLMLF